MKALKDCYWKVSFESSFSGGEDGYRWDAEAKGWPDVGFVPRIMGDHKHSLSSAKRHWRNVAKLNGWKNWEFV